MSQDSMVINFNQPEPETKQEERPEAPPNSEEPEVVSDGTPRASSFEGKQRLLQILPNIIILCILWEHIFFAFALILGMLLYVLVSCFLFFGCGCNFMYHLRQRARIQRAMRNLPVHTVQQFFGDDRTCSICLSNIEVGNIVRSLPCKHDFHKKCIDAWLNDHATCPYCRQDVGLPQ